MDFKIYECLMVICLVIIPAALLSLLNIVTLFATAMITITFAAVLFLRREEADGKIITFDHITLSKLFLIMMIIRQELTFNVADFFVVIGLTLLRLLSL